MKKIMPFARLCAVLGISISLAGTAVAQAIASAELPDAPEPQQSVSGAPPATATHGDPQTKRILGIFPNFRAVSAQTHLPPQSIKDKFVTASQDSFDYSAFVLPLILAGEGLGTNNVPEFHSGAAGYGRYFWHSFLDQTDENYMVEFIIPSLTKEDTRYYTLGPGGGHFFKRVGYSVSRSVITRNDSGHDTFNISEVGGAAAAAGISNLYYPRPERTFSKTADKWAVNVGIDAGTFVIREFWPDVNHFLFHGKEGPMQVTP